MPRSTSTTFKSRPLERDDLPRLVDLLEACESVDRSESNRSTIELQRSFDNPPPNTVRVWQLWETEDDRTVGYGRYTIFDRPEDVCEAYPSVRVHPDYRDSSLERDILAWCEQEVRRLKPNSESPIHFWTGVRSDKPHYRQLYEDFGYQAVRWFYQMRRSLLEPIPEPNFPEGFTVRTCQGEVDAEPWVEMFNQTFIDRWNFHPLPIENYRHHVQLPTYRADLNWLALSPDGTFSAFCGCRIFEERNTRNGRKEGWVEVLGTRRGFRRRGLGRAMLLLGLHELKAAGMEIALLGVDSENPNQARRLYESVGFEHQHTGISYTKKI
ncbi:MAG: GNAT family N-acetyltransferase [Cyanobacteria bacterium SID2]|nr:GNAT family N-acetyltransferase [Cyanobacteria bacterium SID2]